MTLYKKEVNGKRVRYRPVREEVEWDSFPAGFHLLHVKPGFKSITYRVDPDTASLVAASKVAVDAMVKALMDAGTFRPEPTPLTKKQSAAWEEFQKAMGPGRGILYASSARDTAEAGIRALIEEAKKTLEPPA